jgi:hypothetical protein
LTNEWLHFWKKSRLSGMFWAIGKSWKTTYRRAMGIQARQQSIQSAEDLIGAPLPPMLKERQTASGQAWLTTSFGLGVDPVLDHTA